MTPDRLILPEGATRLQLLLLADDARAEARRRHCYAQLATNRGSDVIGRCDLDVDHDGPHTATLFGNHPKHSELWSVAVRWETGK